MRRIFAWMKHGVDLAAPDTRGEERGSPYEVKRSRRHGQNLVWRHQLGELTLAR